MPKRSSNIKILYHKVRPTLDCPDGIYAAYTAKRKFPTAQLIGCIYQQEPPKVNDGDKLIIVDFSFPIEVINGWRDRSCEVILIDHHKTLVDKVREYCTKVLMRSMGVYLQSTRNQQSASSELKQGASALLIDSVFSAVREKQEVKGQPVFQDFLTFLRFTGLFTQIKQQPVWCDRSTSINEVLDLDFSSDRPEDYTHDQWEVFKEFHTLIITQIEKFMDVKGVASLFRYFSDGELRFDNKKCGAVLTWEYFFPDEPVPALLLFAQDRDLWVWRLPHSKQINEALAHVGRTQAIYDELLPLTLEQLTNRFIDLGNILVNPKLEKAKELAAGAVWRDILGYRVLVVELQSLDAYYYNDVMEYLYTHNPDSPFVATYIKLPDDAGYKFSFRSPQIYDGFDVSSIAAKFGGGGHFFAAGAKLRKLPWETTETIETAETNSIEYLVKSFNGTGAEVTMGNFPNHYMAERFIQEVKIYPTYCDRPVWCDVVVDGEPVV